ncbi:universal stress protein [Francisella sp. 19X1-34]|uniref:universal stress protein n=1 Tax=Francisella sp. 19X1-34 TaxID=3087177 RepID=UPI002E2F77B9|nr:universal stress protein [Francisella sp. 19X1-34]MED7789535.1 universal stress protein [Francisella sp. 19X1-34]
MNSVKQNNTKLTIAHYIQSLVSAYPAYFSYNLSKEEDIQKQMVNDAKDKLLPILSNNGLSEENLIIDISTDIRVSILDKANELGADIICLNSHKHNLFARIGSVADYIVNNSKCDVLVLK